MGISLTERNNIVDYNTALKLKGLRYMEDNCKYGYFEVSEGVFILKPITSSNLISCRGFILAPELKQATTWAEQKLKIYPVIHSLGHSTIKLYLRRLEDEYYRDTLIRSYSNIEINHALAYGLKLSIQEYEKDNNLEINS